MKIETKTKNKAQLIAELNELKSRIAELEEYKARCEQKEALGQSEEQFMNLLPASDDANLLIEGQTLTEYMEMYKIVMNSSIAGHFILKDYKLLYANPRMHKLFGYEPGEMVGKLTALDLVVKEDHKIVKRNIALRKKGVQVPEYELRGQRKDKSVFYGLVLGSIIRYQGEQAIFVAVIDITARKLAEQKLLQSNRQLEQERKMFIGGVVVTFKWQNKEGWPAEYVSPNVLRVLGYTAEQFLSGEISYADIIFPEDLERVANEIKKSSDSGEDRFVHQPYRIKKKDGETRWIEDYTTILRNDSGKITHYHGYIIDVTERVAAGKKLRKSESQLRQIIDLVPHFIFVKDETGKFEIVNKATAAVFGTTVEDLTGRRDTEFVATEEEKEHFRADDLEVINSGRTKIIPEEPITDSENNIRYLQTIKVPFKFSSSKKPSLLGVSVDITERKQVEQALEEKTMLLDNILTSARDVAIATTDLDFRITYFNPLAEQFLGYKAEQVIGKTVMEMHTREKVEPRRFEQAVEIMLKEGQYRYSFQQETEDGLRYLDSRVMGIFDSNGEMVGFSLFSYDVTKRKQAEEKLLQSNRQLEQERKMFIGGVVVTFKWQNKEGWPAEYVSPNVLRVLGYTAEQFISGAVSYADIISPEDLERVANEVKKGSDSGEDRFVHQPYRIKKKDGDTIWIEDYTTILRNDSGEITHYLGYIIDITERIQAEQALKKSEEKYRLITENAFDFIWTLDMEMNITYASQSVFRILGYTPEEMLTINVSDLYSQENFRKIQNILIEELSKGMPHKRVVFQINHLRKDKTEFPVEVAAKIIYNENGQPKGIQGYTRDISEQKKAEKEKEIFHRLTLQLTNPITLKEAGKIIAREAQNLFNYDAFYIDLIDEQNEMLIGIYNEDTMEGDTKPQATQVFDSPLKNTKNKDVLKGKPKLINRKGKKSAKEFHVFGSKERISGSLMFAPLSYQNKVIGIVSVQSYTAGKYSKDDLQLFQIFADHSGGALVRSKIEKELRNSEERFRAIFETAQDSIFIKDLNLRYTQVNPAMERLFGLPSDKIIGRTDAELFGEKSGTYITDVDSRVLSGNIIQEEHTKPVKEVLHTFNVIKVPMLDHSKKITGLCGIARDITERLQLEQEKEELRAQLYQNQKLESIGTLASGVAHEVNNPLMGIINYAQLINDSIEEEKLKQFSKGIIEEGERVAKIVKNLLSFARQEKEQHSPAKIIDIINASLMLFGAVFRKNHIQVIQNIPANLPNVICHSQQIEQVVVNLLTNAKDALNQRYPGYHKNKILKIEVKPFEKDKIDWMRITVEDHGVGIPDEVIGRIFDPFFTTKPREEGTGLGLSVSYGIIKEHKGKLSVESEPGEFTRFHIDLRV